jgi:hypothetical protein
MEYEYVPLITFILFKIKNDKLKKYIYFNFFVFQRLQYIIQTNPYFLFFAHMADNRYYTYGF